MRITYLGHAFFVIDTMDTRIVIDPFIVKNKKISLEHRAKYENADYVMFTHAHYEHMDLEIMKYCPNATIISNPEICAYLHNKYNLPSIALNLNEKRFIDCNTYIARVKAVHNNDIEDNGVKFFAGIASGFIINYVGTSIYHMGDTFLFSEMKQIQEMFKPQIALVPIGGKRTMDIEEASMAVNSHFNFDLVIPMHYNTFPYIKADPNEFKKKVNFHNVKILDIGDRVNV